MPAITSFSYWEKITLDKIDVEGDFNPYQRILLDVFFLDDNPDYGWVCGYNSIIIRTTDGGDNWIASKALLDNQLEHIMFVNEKVGFTSGQQLNHREDESENGSIFKSTDGGATWRNISPIVDDNGSRETSIWGHYFTDENTGIAIRSGCGEQTIYRTTDGGESWTSVSYNVDATSMCEAILLNPEGKGYASSSGWIWETTDGGRTWDTLIDVFEIYEEPDFPDAIDTVRGWQEEITYSNGSFLVPFSWGCTGATAVDYGGAKFIKNYGEEINIEYFDKAFFGTFLINDSTGWAVGHDESVFYTEDYGRTWESRNCGITIGKALDDLWFTDENTGFLVGDAIYRYTGELIEPEPKIIAGNVCDSDSIFLTLDSKYDSVTWYNANKNEMIGTGDTIYVTDSDIYVAFAINDILCANGAYSNPIEINFPAQREIRISAFPSKISYCENEEVILQATVGFDNYNWNTGENTSEIKVNSPGEYIVESYVEEFDCYYRDTIRVTFSAIPEAIIEYEGNFINCSEESAVLRSANEFETYEWYRLEENTTSLFSNEREISISETGRYFLRIIDEYGCENISESLYFVFEDNFIELEFNSENSVDFDTVLYPDKYCKELIIRNTSSEIDHIIDSPYLYENIEFSLPLSQFPIVIPAGEERNLHVCFLPAALGLRADTLLFNDICSPIIVPLKGVGGIVDIEGNTRCDLDLDFNSVGFPNSKIRFGEPYPNPSNEKISVNFETNLPSIKLDIIIIDYLGNIGKFDRYEITYSDIVDKKAYGTVELFTNDLPTGTYLVLINNSTNYHSFKIQIQK